MGSAGASCFAAVAAGATFALVATLSGAACGDFDPPLAAADASIADAAPPTDASDAATSANDADAFVPAPHLAYPQLSYGGGAVLAPLRLVVATFPGDPLAPDVAGFASSIPASDWWRTVNQGACDDAGNCVADSFGDAGGAARDAATDVRTVVFAADAAAAYAQTDVATLVHDAIGSGELPLPDANTLYIVSFPLSTTLTTLPTGTGAPAGTSCSTFLEYHRQLYIGDLSFDGGDGAAASIPARVPFVALPRCSRQASDLSVPLGRGLVAAAQDPAGSSYVLRAPDGWNAYFGTEAPDLCAPLAPVSVDGVSLPRIWSNAASIDGDPCLPSDGQTYFAVAPHDAGDVYIPFSQTVTIPLDVFSDGPTGDFQLEAADLDEILAGMPTLDVALDRTMAKNGDTANVTVHFNSPPGERGFAVVVFFAVQGTTVHAWPLAVHLE